MENHGNRPYRQRPFYKGRGHGRGQSNSSSTRTNKKPHVNKEIKFHLHGVGKDKHTCSYTKVLEKIFFKVATKPK